jgi:adenosylhomocysteine nucleosidase
MRLASEVLLGIASPPEKAQHEARMSQSLVTFVCFAVKEEAQPFRKLTGSRPDLRVLLTGMGPRNAERAIRSALAAERPARVLTCGLAGGLKPDLTAGTVLFSTDTDPYLQSVLVAADARPGRFHSLDRVASTAAEKRRLWESTGADAVEMESQVICAVCSEHQVPCATVRVILDTADEDLPLDFNLLRTPDWQLDGRKLTLLLLRSPSKMGALLRLRKQTRTAAEKLAEVLATATRSAV